MPTGRRLCACLLAFTVLIAIAGPARAQSDRVDGPLIRPAVSSQDPRDLSGVWFIRGYNRQINATVGRVPDLIFGPARPGDIRTSLGCPAAARAALNRVAQNTLTAGLNTLLASAHPPLKRAG